jgi:pimeloyl-ACP methyl ester carboxylesterase
MGSSRPPKLCAFNLSTMIPMFAPRVRPAMSALARIPNNSVQLEHSTPSCAIRSQRPGRALGLCAVVYAAVAAASKSYSRRLASATELADPDSRFVDVDSVVVHGKRYAGSNAGQPSVETVVALHGFGSSCFSYEKVLPLLLALRPAAVAWSFDSPGFGLTSRPSLWRLAQYRPAFARQVVSTLVALEERDAQKPIILIGHSLGARGVIEAAEHIDRAIRALVLVAPAFPSHVTGCTPRGLRRMASRWLHAAWLYALVAFSVVLNPVLLVVLRILVGSVSFWMRGLGLARFRPVPQRDVDGYRKPLGIKEWDKGILHFSRAAVLERALATSPEIHPVLRVMGRDPATPVLIVHGRDDKVIPVANSRALHAQLPGSRLVIMPGVGHIPHEGTCFALYLTYSRL